MFTGPESQPYTSGFVEAARIEHLKMIQGVINRLATCSFQLKGWVVTLAAALQVFLKGEANPAYLFVPALPVIAFWFLDGWYLRQERLFRRLYDNVRGEEATADFSMDTQPFRKAVGSVMKVTFSRTLLLFYGPVLIVLLLLESLLLHKAR
jgi:hypothetical protein